MAPGSVSGTCVSDEGSTGGEEAGSLYDRVVEGFASLECRVDTIASDVDIVMGELRMLVEAQIPPVEDIGIAEGGLGNSLPAPEDCEGARAMDERDDGHAGSASPVDESGSDDDLAPGGDEGVEPDLEPPTTRPTIHIRAARWVRSNGRFTSDPADVTEEEQEIMAGARATLRLRRAAASPRDRGRGSDVHRGRRGRGCGRGSSTVDHAAEQSSFVAGLLPCSPEEAGSANHLLLMQLEGHLGPISAVSGKKPTAKSGGLSSSNSSIPVEVNWESRGEVGVAPASQLDD